MEEMKKARGHVALWLFVLENQKKNIRKDCVVKTIL
jgi:hypothetical protein